MTVNPALAKRAAASAKRAPVRIMRRSAWSFASVSTHDLISGQAGDDALVGQRQLHDAAVEGPGTDPDAWPEPGVEGVSSNLHRLLTVLVAGRRSGSTPRRRLAR